MVRYSDNKGDFSSNDGEELYIVSCQESLRHRNEAAENMCLVQDQILNLHITELASCSFSHV